MYVSPFHIQVARFTIDVSFAVAAPKLHSSKNHLKPFRTQYNLKLHFECGFPPPDFAGPSHNDCRPMDFSLMHSPSRKKAFHIQMVFLIFRVQHFKMLHSEYQKKHLNMDLKTRQIMAAALPEMPTRM